MGVVSHAWEFVVLLDQRQAVQEEPPSPGEPERPSFLPPELDINTNADKGIVNSRILKNK